MSVKFPELRFFFFWGGGGSADCICMVCADSTVFPVLQSSSWVDGKLELARGPEEFRPAYRTPNLGAPKPGELVKSRSVRSVWELRTSSELRKMQPLEPSPPTRNYTSTMNEGFAKLSKLISEPQSSTPCDMRFFPRDTGKIGHFEALVSEWPFSLYRLGKIAYRKG